MITDKLISDLAAEVSKNATQRKRCVVMGERLRDTLVVEQGVDPGTVVEGDAVPRLVPPCLADVVVFVVTGEGTTDADVAAVRDGLDGVLAKVQAADPTGRVHVVTAGRRGVEETAERWAAYRRQPLTIVSALWVVPQLDGSTRRDPNARGPRNRKLQAMCRDAARLGTALVLCWGKERDNDVVEQMLVAAGARPRMTSKHYRAERHAPSAQGSTADGVEIQARMAAEEAARLEAADAAATGAVPAGDVPSALDPADDEPLAPEQQASLDDALAASS